MSELDKSRGSECENIATIQAEVNASFRAARERVAERFRRRNAATRAESRNHVRELIRASRERTHTLLAEGPENPSAPFAKPELTLQDLHTLERLVSYVRHSVVRVCFYNLKLFCPSLLDECDEHVREQVMTNIGQLAAVREELTQFFSQTVSSGRTVAESFTEAEREALEQLDSLIILAGSARNGLDDEALRRDFANRAPALIDAVMAALQDVQKELDSRKMALGEVVERAVSLTQPAIQEAGLAVTCRFESVPKVFGNESALLNCFVELVTNAAKYSNGTDVAITVELLNRGGQYVQVVFADNGKGMTTEELQSCLARGSSRAGTGEGLPMILQIVEAEHLGEFSIEAGPNHGCRAAIRLPVRWSPKRIETIGERVPAK